MFVPSRLKIMSVRSEPPPVEPFEVSHKAPPYREHSDSPGHQDYRPPPVTNHSQIHPPPTGQPRRPSLRYLDLFVSEFFRASRLRGPACARQAPSPDVASGGLLYLGRESRA